MTKYLALALLFALPALAQSINGVPNQSTTSIPAGSLPIATTSTLGAVKCDGSTIACTSGVISTVAGGGGAGGGGNPALCTTQTANSVCVTQPPYKAQTTGATTTTTTGTFGVGTSGPVASCSTFGAGNGVYIAGAGASGSNYIGSVVSCSGTTLTVNPATSTSVASGAVVQHDETAAFQAAITAMGAGGVSSGTIYVPVGVYRINGPLQDTGGANAVLTLPSAIANTGNPPQYIRIIGLSPSSQGDLLVGTSLIETDVPSGSLIGGYNSGGTQFTGFTNYWLELDNLNFQPTFTNNTSALTMIDGSHLMGLQMHNDWVGGPGVAPTNPASYGVKMPWVYNNVENTVDSVWVTQFYNSFQFTEHTQISSAYAVVAVNAFVFDGGTNGGSCCGGYASNSISADYLWALVVTNGIVGGSHLQAINIQNADIESSTNIIYDPSNNLRGIVNWANAYPGNSSPIVGAAYLNDCNLYSGLCEYKAAGDTVASFSTGYQYDGGVSIANTTSKAYKLDVLGSGYGATAGRWCLADVTDGNTPGFCQNANVGFMLAGTNPLTWASGSLFGTNSDTSLSRTGPASLALGNGTQGNASGTLALANLNVTNINGSPYSAGGTGGGIAYGTPTAASVGNGGASLAGAGAGGWPLSDHLFTLVVTPTGGGVAAGTQFASVIFGKKWVNASGAEYMNCMAQPALPAAGGIPISLFPYAGPGSANLGTQVDFYTQGQALTAGNTYAWTVTCNGDNEQ